jgi:hypothetical protein
MPILKPVSKTQPMQGRPENPFGLCMLATHPRHESGALERSHSNSDFGKSKPKWHLNSTEIRTREAPRSKCLSADEITTKVIGTEARMANRVPIGKKPAPFARLSTQDGPILLPIPIDISLTGILVEFAAAEDPDLTPSEEADLELRLGDDTIHLRAELRRRDGHRYGLFFPRNRNQVRRACTAVAAKYRREPRTCLAPGDGLLHSYRLEGGNF